MARGILPNMLIVGALKCGTTTLWAHLASQRAVCMSEKKELWFFTDDELWGLGADWYRQQFSHWKGERVVGEATPMYMYSEKAKRRIRRLTPDVRLIFVLRNPVERAYSHYWHNVKKLKEGASFEEAILNDYHGRVNGDWRRGSGRYFTLGCYHRFLCGWVEEFSKEAIHVVVFEEMVRSPAGAVKSLLAFLGEERLSETAPSVHENRSKYFRKGWMECLYREGPGKALVKKMLTDKMVRGLKRAREKMVWSSKEPKMNDEIQRFLRRAYEDEIGRLENLFGMDLSVWR